MKIKVFLIIVLLLIPWLKATAADERGFGRIPPGEKRIALVIGNNDYIHLERLNNAIADARAMKQELAGLGFEVVYRQNASRKDMYKATTEFIRKLSTDTVGMVFYAGHGVQINSANYLIPVDIEAQDESDIIHDSIDVAGILQMMSATHAKFSLVILDACRDNPFKDNGSRSIGGTRGLATPSSNASGVMIVYSAGANQQALDRLSPTDTNPNGLFTRELLKAIKKPGVRIQDTVTDLRQSVIDQAKSVGHIQTPAVYDESVGTFFFLLPQDQQEATTVEPYRGGGQLDRESIFWQSTQDDPESCQDYLRQWPQGVYAVLAKHCIENGREKSRRAEEDARRKTEEARSAQADRQRQEAERKRRDEAERARMQLPMATTGTSNLIHGRYLDHGDGTVSDMKTRLRWKRCAVGQAWTGSTCVGKAIRYKWNALPRSENGWRIPTIDELKTLRVCAQQSFWTENCYLNDSQQPNFDQDAFPGFAKWNYWSSSEYAADPSDAWALDFKDGGVYNHGKEHNLSIRLVYTE